MKKIFFLLICILFALSSQAQNYRVLHIKNGTISDSKGTLKPRGVVNGKSKVRFSSSATFAVLVDDKQNQYTLKAPSGLSGVVSKSITKNTRTSSRAAEVIGTSAELAKHFNDNSYLVLDNSIGVHIRPDVALVDKSNFYIVRYDYNGTAINKKLYTIGDTVYLNKDSLYMVDNEPIVMPDSVKMNVSYYQAASKKRTDIGEIQIIFPNNDNVVADVKLVIEDFKKQSSTFSQLEGQVAMYLSSLYGVPHKGDLEEWLKKYFEISPSDFE